MARLVQQRQAVALEVVGLSLAQSRAGALPIAELAKQLPKAAKTLTQLFSPLVAAPADRLLVIVGRQHGEPFRGATLAVGRPRRIVGMFSSRRIWICHARFQ